VWRRAIDQDRPSPSSVALIAGPDLRYAAAEIAALRTCRPHATVVVDDTATCEHVMGALATHDTAHIAAHYVAKRGNPLFSSIRLADGDLVVHELAALSQVPRLLVLAACDSAVSTVRPVDELLGAAAALLSLGARDVIASCTVVPDCDATVDFSERLHRALVDDEEPAAALAHARALVADREEPAAAVVAAGFIAMGA
jgi:CHAT domain-containing protein